MDTIRELKKIKQQALDKGIPLQELSIKAGLHKYYITNALSRTKNHSEAMPLIKPIHKLQEALRLEQAKIDSKVLAKMKAAETKATPSPLPAPVTPSLIPEDHRTVAQLIDAIVLAARQHGVYVSDVSRKLGFDKCYIVKVKARATDPKWRFWPKTEVTLRQHLTLLDQIRDGKLRKEDLITARRPRKVKGRGRLLGTFTPAPIVSITPTVQAPLPLDNEPTIRPVYPEALPQHFDMDQPPPKKEEVKAEARPTAQQLLIGMIDAKLQGMSIVQLSLLLAHIAGEEGK